MPTQEDAQGRNATASETVGAMTGRRDVDVQLRKSEEFNRSLMDASPDCVKVLDLDGRVLHMNTPGLCAMEIDEFGSVCGQEWQSLWPEDVRGDIERSVARSLGGEVSMFQAYCPTAKGTPKWWEVTVSPVRDSVGGRVVQLLSISRDITQRKQAEDRLRESEAEFRAAFEQSAVGMAQIAATTGRFVRVNAKYCELTGYSAEELAGTSPLDLHFTDDRDAEATAVRQFLRGETALYDAETRYLRKDGKVIWVHVNSTMMCNAEGRPERTMAVIQDITTRKQAEEKLRESEERLRLAIRAGGLGIWETNIESGRRLWSPEAMAIFGLDLADGIGRFGGDDDELHSRVHPDDRHLLDHYRLDLIEAGLIKAEYRIVLPKGDIRWLAGGAMVLTRDPAGDPVTSIHIAADITARKQAETVLSDSEARMRLALDAAQLGVREVNLETNQAVTTTETARILGFKVGEIPTSEAYRARIHPGDQEQEAKSWRYAVSDPTKKYSAQYRFLRPDGRWIWLATSGTVIFEGNRPLRMIAVIQDITDQKRRERDFAFLADLQADNATFARTADALKALGKRIADHLSASGCNFIEIDRHAGSGKVLVDNVAADQPNIFGTYELEHFNSPEELRELAAGRVLGINDVRDARPASAAANFEALGIRALVIAPYVLSGVWRFSLAVTDGHPRQWLREELDFLSLLAERVYFQLERERDEDRLRESEERYRSLFESMDEGYCVIEMVFDATGRAADYRFLEINPAFEKQTGLAGATGRRMRELVPDLEEHWFETYGQVARTGEPVRFVDQTKAMEGRWFDVYAFRLGESGSDKVAILFNNISERMRTEGALRASEERLRAATEAVSDVVWTNNAHGLMQGEQAGWQEFTGQSPEEYQGFGWTKAIHPEDAQPTINAWKQAVADKRAFEFEHRVRRHDGEWRRCSVRAVPILNVDGAIREWVGVHSDITERKRDEEKLQQFAAQLSEASYRKDEFLATLAHELRNPLAPIRNGLQVMKLAGGQNATLEQARAMMERQLTQMVRLVDDLMDVSRISQGKLELRKKRVPLETVLNSAVETSRPLIDKMGHELTVTLPNQPIMVDADTTRLAQVFLNLLNNGAKYSDRGGHLQLKVERQGGDVVVTVKDTGIGIPADQLPHIFEMFTQVGGALEKSQGGLGIGLTLVKRLVEMHGGTVEAHSDGPGKGSEFVVRLPLAIEVSQPPVSGAEDEPSATMSSLRILIVDDNRDGADSLSEMLTLMGNQTRTAYDGQEGVDIAAEYQPHVILLDIGLPKLNGYEACRIIRQQLRGKDTVLVAVTGWGQDKDRQRTREAGFDHHLVKPLDPQDLMTILAGLRVGTNAS